MWSRQLIRDETGCASYMIASAETGEAVVFDPLWDIGPYLDLAGAHELSITHVIDSHSHADHVSGARRLAKATGSDLYLPELMDASYPARRLGDGEILSLGEVKIEVIHVPGHRPEQINLLVSDLSRGPEPWFMLTADFLLVGDVARPDLAQDGPEGTRQLFTRALPRLEDLPDYVEVYPGHVAGST